MLHDQMLAAIDGARTLSRLDELSRTIWQAFSAGAVTDDQAQQLAERIHAVRGVARKEIKPVGISLGRGTLFPPRRAQVTPDRAASRTRRRRLASAGPMPPALAQCFTQGELATLAIIAAEVREKGLCGASLAEIAARAGVGRSTAKNAVREASRQGLVTVQERRRQGQKNNTNLIRIVSREWVAWLARGWSAPSTARPVGETVKPEAIGVKKVTPTDSRSRKAPEKEREETTWRESPPMKFSTTRRGTQ